MSFFGTTHRTSRSFESSPVVLEPLEQRCLLSLIGVVPQVPLIGYDSTGVLAYTAATEKMDISATALTFLSPTGGPRTFNGVPNGVQIHLKVDGLGNLVGGVDGPDLSVSGSVDLDGNGTIDASGALLTGEIEEFGFQDTGTITDTFDFRFAVTGGTLANLYAGKDLGVTLACENSTFTGSFLTDFGGHAKGNIGAIPGVTIGDYVWNDANANGIQDSGEAGIPGVKLTLIGNDLVGNAVSGSTTTDATGHYLFTETPGTYTVTVDASNSTGSGALVGYNASATLQGLDTAVDSNPSPSGTNPSPLPGGSSDLTVDFGYYQPVTIGDFVWNDASANGVQDGGELGIPGVTLTLSNGDTATTDASGHYLFTEAPGTYTVTVDAGNFSGAGALVGFTASPTLQGGDTALDSNPQAAGTTPAALPGGSSDLSLDFGYYQKVTIGDYVWKDMNANGIQDDGAAGINGVKMDLLIGNVVNATTTTINSPVDSAPGYYQFSNLTPGTYTVAVDASNFTGPGALVGYTASPTLQGGNPALDSNPQPAGTTPSPLLSGGSDETLDFGYYQPVNNPPPVIDIEKYVKDAQSQSGCQGLTPGFWKQCQHFQYWVGFTQSDSYNAVFGVNDPGNPTLLGALQRGGGGNAALGRQAVAALLNASNGGISFAFNRGDVIALVQYAYATGNYDGVESLLEAQNSKDSFGLPSGHGTWSVGFGADADAPPGLATTAGDLVVFTYVVTNPGSTNLSSIKVVDDNETPGNAQANTADDFHPTPVLSGLGFNVGDLNHDNVLQPGEQWLYVWSKPVTAGQHQNVATVTGLAGGTSVSDQDAANWFAAALGGISGHKYLDLSGNGLTSDDTGLGGTKIQLFKDINNDGKLTSADGSAVASVITANGTGSYSFSGLASGVYFVQEVTPSGYVRTFPTLSDSYKVDLTNGGSVADRDFANFALGCTCGVTNIIYTVNGTCTFTDLRGHTNQGDLVQATFTVGAGAPVTLSLVSYTAPQSYYDANTASQQQIVDLATGTFGPGTYKLSVVAPNSNYQVDFVCGLAIDHLGPAGSNIFYSAQNRLFSADNDGTQAVLCNPSNLAGNVYVDANNDGIKQSTEQGIGLVVINLTGTDNKGHSVSLTRLTKPDGSYNFDNLAPGTYKITDPPPAGYLDGKDTLGTLGGTLGNDLFSSISLAAGAHGLAYNFGEVTSSTLKGFVYSDIDNDGKKESGERGISGVTIKLTGTDDQGKTVSLTTTTDSTGAFSFANLRAGTYKIAEVDPSGWGDGKDIAGSLGGTVANDTFSGIKVAAGQTGTNYNFGERA